MASPEPVAGKAAARSTLSGTTVLRLHELPAAVSEALSHYDKDGDGVIDINELVNAGTQAQFDAKNVRRLVKVAVALFCLCVFNLAAIFGLVFSVVALTKDSKVDSNNQLVTRSGTPVSTAPALAVLPIGATALPAAFAYVAFTTAQGFNFSLSVDGASSRHTGDPHHHCMLTSRLGTLPLSPGYVAIPNQPGAAVLFTKAGNLLYYQGDATPFDTTIDALAASVITPAAAYLQQQLSAGRRLLSQHPGGGAQVALVMHSSRPSPSIPP